MAKGKTMVYGALLLTGANLALRVVSMGFQVYLSRKIGASGVGLLQLTMSVCTLAMAAAMAGIRTATMYLTARCLGTHGGNLGGVLKACCLYALGASGAVALGVWFLGPWLAQNWIGHGEVMVPLRIFAVFLPVVCQVGVWTGFYTAQSRVKALVAIEVAEQVVSMVLTVLLLNQWAGSDPGRAISSVLGGSSLAGLMTLGLLVGFRGPMGPQRPTGETVVRPLLKTALPLALADVLRMGISTLENLMVPRRLGLFSGAQEALASFGRVCGMVFPVLMFPACILYSLAEMLIPELSLCAAGKRQRRVTYLTGRSLQVGVLYGVAAGGLLWVCADGLGMLLYNSPEVGRLLRAYAVLVPMLYADIITDAVIKGMGQQVASVRYNILTTAMDVVFLWILLPQWGLAGYYVSFLVTHGVNFCLSIRRLTKATGYRPDLTRPLLGLLAGVFGAAVCLLLPDLPGLVGILVPGAVYLLLLGLGAGLLGVVGKEDWAWFRTLLGR